MPRAWQLCGYRAFLKARAHERRHGTNGLVQAGWPCNNGTAIRAQYKLWTVPREQKRNKYHSELAGTALQSSAALDDTAMMTDWHFAWIAGIASYNICGRMCCR